MLFYNWWFCEGASMKMCELIKFHDILMVLLMFICGVVVSILCVTWGLKPVFKTFKGSDKLEVVWTLVPVLLLLAVAYPSVSLLFLMDSWKPAFLPEWAKVVGHQWYWHYEFSGKSDIYSFDSFLVPSSEVVYGSLSLLEVDKPLVISFATHSVLLGSSEDVMHAFAVPQMGLKMDVVPGRLSQTSFVPTTQGKFFGQCSEICGANHSFMPISVEVVMSV